ncbi:MULTISPECIES: GNAT family N-acetyltransferase [unclassified Lysinibacillus]|uniref:GNAT family N-acetyltransferase n=1 Tax=unclassified Lysinibacillus TaxID=2636778 RepID=UPI00381F9519
MEIREYQLEDEIGWVRCRVLSFLNTAYFDNVLKKKETYANPAIELVAIKDHQVIGLIDVEYEVQPQTVCSQGDGLGGMIWHIAVHPDYQKMGVGHQLLKAAEKRAKGKKVNRLEAWTRDDEWVNDWYINNKFSIVDSYLQVFIEGENEMKQTLKSEIPELYPVQAFAHYVGKEKEMIKNRYTRVHECFCFEKKLL